MRTDLPTVEPHWNTPAYFRSLPKIHIFSSLAIKQLHYTAYFCFDICSELYFVWPNRLLSWIMNTIAFSCIICIKAQINMLKHCRLLPWHNQHKYISIVLFNSRFNSRFNPRFNSRYHLLQYSLTGTHLLKRHMRQYY